MEAADNRKSMERAIDAFNERDIDAVEATSAENYVDHEVVDKWGPGFQATRRNIERFIAAFPDARWEIVDIVSDDRVGAVRLRVTGTDEGEFMDIEPTGRRIDWAVVDFLHFDVEGRVTDHWGYGDRLALIEQLGVSRQAMLTHARR